MKFKKTIVSTGKALTWKSPEPMAKSIENNDPMLSIEADVFKMMLAAGLTRGENSVVLYEIF